LNELSLTVAFSDYDHVRDLADGRVRTPGLRLRFLDMTVPEIFGRFSKHREWEVSEFGLGKYVAHRDEGDVSIVAIPVFPSRMFRLTAFYVRHDSPMHHATDLIGKRVGVPEWAQTAGIYARGWLTHEAGVGLDLIEWAQAGVNEPGRREKVGLHLPPGVVCTPMPEHSLDEMVISGAVDAILTAQAPQSYVRGDGTVRRLFSDPRQLEEESWAATGIFPIMHTVVVRHDVLEDHPWVAANLLAAFEEAKQRSVGRMVDWTATRVPIPWAMTSAEQARQWFDGEYWPYGVEPNRRTLEAFLGFAHEQGVTSRLLAVGDLFAETTLEPIRT